jgi:hypothetical protein
LAVACRVAIGQKLEMPWNQEEEWEKVRRLRSNAEECRAAAAGTKVEEG